MFHTNYLNEKSLYTYAGSPRLLIQSRLAHFSWPWLTFRAHLNAANSVACAELRCALLQFNATFTQMSISISQLSNVHKCDLGQPSCTRCLKSGIKCSGPTAGSVFVHRDVNNIHRVSDRKMLSHAFQNRHLDTTTLPTATIKELHGSAQSNKLIAPISIPSSMGCSMDLYRSAVADLWIVTCHPATIPIDQNVESPMSSSAREILPLAFGSKTLDSALFAVATMFMGKLRSDSKLQGLALAAYPPALSRFRSELALGFGSKTSQTNRTVRAIAISLTLLFYEVCVLQFTLAFAHLLTMT